MTALLRAEARKVLAGRLWWGLLVPVAVLAAVLNLFAVVVGGGLDELAGDGGASLVAGSLAYALALTYVFAGLHGVVATAGEFRHRTITTSYLTAPSRGGVLAAKAVVAAVVGVGYALVTAVIGLLAGLAGPGLGRDPATLAGVAAVGCVVAALWGVLGTALGTLMSNQVTAVVAVLVYVLLAENLLALLLRAGDAQPLAFLDTYLPVNAADVALYGVPAPALAGEAGPELVGLLAGVTEPLPWAGALLVLAGWTAAAVAAARLVGDRRDIS